MDKTILDYWPILICIIATAVGYGWLQYQVKDNTSDIVELKANQKEEIKDLKIKIDKMSEKLSELCVSFGELAGYMKGRECNDNKQ